MIKSQSLIMLAAAMLLALILSTPIAQANDSSAAITLGGLKLQQNDAISMDSEDLFLSAKQVRVKYRFTNHSKADVTTLVSFPLPAIPAGIEGHMGDKSYPVWTDLQFKTLVNGKPVELKMLEIAEIDGRDVGVRLGELGWPAKFWLDDGFMKRLNQLPPDKLKAYAAQGLIRRLESWDRYAPKWSVATHVTRNQTFPAGKTISVEHSYVPILGGSIAGNMSQYARRNPEYGFAEYRKAFCMNDNFIAGFDKRQKELGERAEQYTETYLSYRLSPGANWKGPIKDFRLVIDKGDAGNLISLCMDGARKISPTQFEVKRSNFEPIKDIDAVIIEWAKPR